MGNIAVTDHTSQIPSTTRDDENDKVTTKTSVSKIVDAHLQCTCNICAKFEIC